MPHFLRKNTVVLFVFLMALQACRKDSQNPLSYTIENSRWDSLPALEVRVAFEPDPSGTTRLVYPDNAWGQDSLWNAVRDVQVSSGRGRLEINRDSGWVSITHGETENPVELKYKVIQDWSEAGGQDLSYRPIIREDYFHVFAHNLLMMPRHYEETGTARIRLEWKGWGPEQVIHNSFGDGQRLQELGELNLERFMSAVYVGGDYTVLSEDVEGNALHLAIRGQWVPFREEQVMGILARTVRAQRDFWQDHSQRYFTVTMRPIRQERGSSFQGTGLTNSFATSISNNESTELEQLIYLFNHELMHNWIGHTIENESEEAEYWFSEGFTEYYTAKNIAANRIGGLDWAYYIDRVNETIRLLEASPVKTAPNSEINYENFWGSRDFEKLPYQRGFLFAFYLDQEIRAVSEGTNSLDDLMRDLLADALRDGTRLNAAHFVRRANPYLVEDLGPFLARHIEEGAPLPLETLFRDLELDYELGAELFDLGFKSNEGWDTVLGVDTASAAYRSGVRQGDRIVSRSIYLGTTEREVELVLEREGRRVPVSYFPARRAPVPQLLNTGANREALSR